MLSNHCKIKAAAFGLALAATLVSATPGLAQKRKKNNATPPAESTTYSNLRRHLAVLAADSLEGRRTGTAGEQKAIAYISNYHRQLGLSPAGDSGSFFQPFEVDEGKVLANSHLTINAQQLEPLKAFFPMVWSANGAVNAASIPALNEAGTPWWHDVKDDLEANSQNPHFVLEETLKTLAKTAASKGATALLIYNSGSKPDSLAFNKKDRSAVAALPVFYVTRAAMATLKLKAGEETSVEGSVNLAAKRRTGYNVVALLNNHAEKTIILGAHLDHLGYGEDENSRHVGEPAIHNGADDNASGTAALLELARLLKTQPFTAANVLFVHFSGEELGLYGSKHFADHSPVPLNRVVAMINMDMVGRLSDSTKVLTVGGVGTATAWPNLLNAPAHPEFVLKIDSSGTGPSDHTSFYRKNIPVLFFFTGLHTDYHKPTDDAELINYAGTEKIVNYIAEIVTQVPAQISNLAFVKTREQAVGTTRFKVSIGIMPDYTFAGTGVRADGVIDGRAAQKAGLQAGDIILQLGEHLVTSVESYMQALNRFDKGQQTTVTIRRGDEVKAIPLTF
jgi:aminopeptidase YwaD